MQKPVPIEQDYHPYRTTSDLRLGLSTLSLPLDSFDVLDYPRGLRVCRMRQEIAEAVRARYVATLAEAEKFRASVVCFGELMFPYGSAGGSAFLQELHGTVFSSGMTVVAGSYHDSDIEPDKNYHNIAPILSPFESKPLRQLKQNPANRVGEKLDVPEKWLVIAGTPACNLACLICLDIREPGFTEYIHYGNTKSGRLRVELVLCPAYDSSHDIRADCRDMAVGAKAWVGFVNACAGDRGLQMPAVFSAGTGAELQPFHTSDKAYYYDLEIARPDVVITRVTD
jgi:hypothetical protein